MLEVRQNGVPGQVHHIHKERPEPERDQGEVKHLDWGPEQQVTKVYLEELVLESTPCLSRSLRLHDRDAVEKGQ